MANDADALSDRKWLTLGMARTMLGINEATLRQWADHGLVRAFRTPGGHRRFSIEDINALIEEGHPETAAGVHVAGDAAVLPRIRRRVKVTTRPRSPAWMDKFDTEGHERMRSLGREFLDLCIGFIEEPGQAQKLEQASELGFTYGKEIASRDIPLADALQAFIFFRNLTTEAIKPTFNKRGATADEVSTAIERLTRLTDQVLISLVACYRQEPLPAKSAATKDP